MRFKSLLLGAAIVLTVSLGTAQALDGTFPQIMFPEGHPAFFNVPHLDPAACNGITNSSAFTVTVC